MYRLPVYSFNQCTIWTNVRFEMMYDLKAGTHFNNIEYTFLLRYDTSVFLSLRNT